MRGGDLRSPLSVPVTFNTPEDKVGDPLGMDCCLKIEPHS